MLGFSDEAKGLHFSAGPVATGMNISADDWAEIRRCAIQRNSRHRPIPVTSHELSVESWYRVCLIAFSNGLPTEQFDALMNLGIPKPWWHGAARCCPLMQAGFDDAAQSWCGAQIDLAVKDVLREQNAFGGYGDEIIVVA